MEETETFPVLGPRVGQVAGNPSLGTQTFFNRMSAFAWYHEYEHTNTVMD